MNLVRRLSLHTRSREHQPASTPAYPSHTSEHQLASMPVYSSRNEAVLRSHTSMPPSDILRVVSMIIREGDAVDEEVLRDILYSVARILKNPSSVDGANFQLMTICAMMMKDAVDEPGPATAYRMTIFPPGLPRFDRQGSDRASGDAGKGPRCARVARKPSSQRRQARPLLHLKRVFNDASHIFHHLSRYHHGNHLQHSVRVRAALGVPFLRVVLAATVMWFIDPKLCIQSAKVGGIVFVCLVAAAAAMVLKNYSDATSRRREDSRRLRDRYGHIY